MSKAKVSVKKKKKAAAFGSVTTKRINYKKLLVYCLFGLAFLFSQWLIFKPTSHLIIEGDVPQASDLQMDGDKIKVYETSLWQESKEKANELLENLSDNWQEQVERQEGLNEQNFEEENFVYDPQRHSLTQAMAHYDQTQRVIDDFYKEDNFQGSSHSYQPKAVVTPSVIPEPTTLEDQLDFVQKSFEIASRYMPLSSEDKNEPSKVEPLNGAQKSRIRLRESNVNLVSILGSEQGSDSPQNVSMSEVANTGFFGVNLIDSKDVLVKDAIPVCIVENKMIQNKGSIKLEVLKDVYINQSLLLKGTTLYATVFVDKGRLEFYLQNIILEGAIVKVDLVGYDNTGHQGLEIYNMNELSPSKEILGNMGQSAQTSISILNPLKDQIASDLTRSAMNGVAGYFSKKQRVARVKLKKGQTFLLMPSSLNELSF